MSRSAAARRQKPEPGIRRARFAEEACGKGVGSQAPKKATRGPVWVGFKTYVLEVAGYIRAARIFVIRLTFAPAWVSAKSF